MADLALFTADLRVSDNPVLTGAGDDAIPVYVSDTRPAIWGQSPNQAAFLSESLIDLDRSLRRLGTSLVYREGDWHAEVVKVVRESGADRVHVARGTPEHQQTRIAALTADLGVPVIVHDSTTVVDPVSLIPQSANYYQRFTPYFKRWRAAARRRVLPRPRTFESHSIRSDAMPQTSDAATSPLRQRAGEDLARNSFGEWLAHSASYETSRDQLAGANTSRISSALRFGQLSPLEVVEAADERGAHAFARQIAWRDFNYQLLFHRPDLERTSLRPGRGHILVDETLLERWQRGLTGYPVIDAAMRQLRETGWMHNRSRMLSASFLTKHLGLDWRAGASWFGMWLTDADVANNQLGWQWAAGVGVDTNPWRMFNPVLQSRRYDPDGTYIRTWVPELGEASEDDIHDPSEITRSRLRYPQRAIEHSDAVARFKARA